MAQTDNAVASTARSRSPAPPTGPRFVPRRCQPIANATLDRGFGLYVCEQRDPRCWFRGPVEILSQTGIEHECRKRSEDPGGRG